MRQSSHAFTLKLMPLIPLESVKEAVKLERAGEIPFPLWNGYSKGKGSSPYQLR
ncbi:hypothetical protein J23TS9_00320 [Paenibacillus sp. J23TS9]|uniref:hypothetical protein n=1 Tax=Paenibacillus sp. J23TS9 TaxID=2807193 RepID=UPI001B2C346A|nr:hypothetical protein [Paenibacillus sp. J23TS9]GIP24902.1 hypothetical protein J23TS9_00320 [Paenibacillus sp. J23TS9]